MDITDMLQHSHSHVNVDVNDNVSAPESLLVPQIGSLIDELRW